MKLLFASLVLSLAVAAPLRAQTAPVPRFALHEISFTATGRYANPYVELTADATLTEPDGRTTRTLPLFWDGGARWKLRFAPDKIGLWKWTVKSADRGLEGRAGSFECVASNRRGSIQPMADAPRHLQYQNGERMWLMADTAWAYVYDNAEEKLDRAAAHRYIDNRAAQGFNAIHLSLLSEAGWHNRGGAPWDDIAAERPNPAYFQEADLRIAYANSRGIVIGLALAWGMKARREPYSWGRLPNVEARKRYAQYVAARYGAYDVYFLVAGEWHGEVNTRPAPEPEIRNEFVMIGDALRAADPYRRMTGIHPMIQHGSTREFNGVAQWMDFADYQQNYRDLHGRALMSRTVAKPVVNSEYAYFLRDQNGDGQVDKPYSYTVDDIRHATWDIVMAGAYVVTGFGSTYLGGFRHPTTFLPDDPKNAPWAEQMGRVKQFFSGLEYWKLEPHDDWVSSNAARTGDRATRVELADQHRTLTQAPATTYWCLAEPGRTYAVYVRGTTQPVTVSVTTGGSWKASRFDPRTGQSENISVTASGDQVKLTAPDEQDWLFVVRNDAARASGRKAAAGKIPPAETKKEIRPAHRDITAPWQPPALKLAGEIVLNAAGPSPLEADRKVLGGAFAPDGWRPAAKNDRLVLTLKEGFDWNKPGAIELDMTNLDFDAQVDGRKQHFFSLFANPVGSHRESPNAFFNLRAGEYKDKQGNRGIKVLWRGAEVRGEAAPFGARKTWDPKIKYTWRAEWTETELVVYLNGERIFGPAEFKDRHRTLPMRHLFLFRDGSPNEKVWFGFVGPVYQAARIYR